MSGLKPALSSVAKALGLYHWVFRYYEWQRSKTDDPPPAVDEDGVPVPSAYLMYVIGGTSDWRFFLKGGEAAVRTFSDLVNRNGGDFQGAQSILDFGCGCGRLARHLPKFTDAAIFGTDYNPRLVKWCHQNLTGTFQTNTLKPPLRYRDAQFDIAYLLSVFTHLRPATQALWLDELQRIIRPGGFALITFHDEHHVQAEKVGFSKEQIEAEEVIIRNDASEGSNYIATFQSTDSVIRDFGKYFDVAEIVDSRSTPVGQAIAVLRRRVN